MKPCREATVAHWSYRYCTVDSVHLSLVDAPHLSGLRLGDRPDWGARLPPPRIAAWRSPAAACLVCSFKICFLFPLFLFFIFIFFSFSSFSLFSRASDERSYQKTRKGRAVWVRRTRKALHPLHRSDLKISAKNREHFFANEKWISDFSFFNNFYVEFCIFCEFLMKICPDFVTKFQKRVTCVAFSIKCAQTT